MQTRELKVDSLKFHKLAADATSDFVATNNSAHQGLIRVTDADVEPGATPAMMGACHKFLPGGTFLRSAFPVGFVWVIGDISIGLTE